MTTNMTNLIRDAKAAGFSIETGTDGYVAIVKRSGRWNKTQGLGIYNDGTAFDLTVDCEAAKGIRSYKTMRAILSI